MAVGSRSQGRGIAVRVPKVLADGQTKFDRASSCAADDSGLNQSSHLCACADRMREDPATVTCRLVPSAPVTDRS